MNASKENAVKAARFFNDLDGARSIPPHGIEERRRFVREFLDAANRKLPTEEAFAREKDRRKK